MKIARICVLVAAASLAPIAAIAAPKAPHTVTVEYRDLNLNDSKDVTALYDRLGSASREVCAHLESKNVNQQRLWRQCVNKTLARAVLRVNDRTLTAMHQSGQRDQAILVAQSSVLVK
jgi:UrcA family protein